MDHKADSGNLGLDWGNAARELVGEDQEVYVLHVRDSSMQDALVDEGNLVVIKAGHSAQDGDMIAAWLKPQQAMTLKYYHRENGHVRLQPANPELPPLELRPSELEILGQVLAIVRTAE